MSRFASDWAMGFENFNIETREKTARSDDGSPKKRIPYSLRSLIKSIRAFWNAPTSTDGLKQISTPEQFIDTHIDEFLALKEKYFFRTNNKTAVKKARNIEGGQAPSYLVLRFFSDCLKIPSSLLLAYSHFIGDLASLDRASRTDTMLKSESVKSLEKMQYALCRLLDEIKATDETDFVKNFLEYRTVQGNAKAAYIINVEGVRILSEAYNDCQSDEK